MTSSGRLKGEEQWGHVETQAWKDQDWEVPRILVLNFSTGLLSVSYWLAIVPQPNLFLKQLPKAKRSISQSCIETQDDFCRSHTTSFDAISEGHG